MHQCSEQWNLFEFASVEVEQALQDENNENVAHRQQFSVHALQGVDNSHDLAVKLVVEELAEVVSCRVVQVRVVVRWESEHKEKLGFCVSRTG